MGLNEILLICAALLPAIALCIYIYKKDRAEKEPTSLLIGLLLCGVLICYPAGELNALTKMLFKSIFSNFGVEIGGTVYLEGFKYTLYVACEYFLGVGLVEETLKWLVLVLVARNTHHFNSLFDGLIYAIFVSLGFAAYENIFYVLEYGWTTALLRAIMSVPGHMFFAVIMGYYYVMYHMTKKAHELEIGFKNAGIIHKDSPEFCERKYLVLSLVLPILGHGFYDFAATIGGNATIALIVFLIFLYVYCFKRIKDTSRYDVDDKSYAYYLLFKNYPRLQEVLNTIAESQKEKSEAVSQSEESTSF